MEKMPWDPDVIAEMWIAKAEIHTHESTVLIGVNARF